MSSKKFLLRPTLTGFSVVGLFMVGCAAPSSPPIAPATSVAVVSAPAPGESLKSLGNSGSQKALETLDRAIAAAGTDRVKISALVTEILEVLKQTDSTFTAQQAVGQR